MTDYIVPFLLLAASVLALKQKENAYDMLLDGAAEGLRLLITLIPTLILLLTSITMLRASGAMEWVSQFLSPAFSFFGIPPETALLVLIRPFSGSAALAVGTELMTQYGVDSLLFHGKYHCQIPIKHPLPVGRGSHYVRRSWIFASCSKIGICWGQTLTHSPQVTHFPPLISPRVL